MDVMNEFADSVMRLCTEKYKSLKKSGKPSDKEWTVLSCIIMKKDDELSVVSLATGTKCLGNKDLLNTTIYEAGSRISDSHAEVLARRAFLRYLYDQIDLTFSENKSAIFVLNNERQIKMKENVTFHFFTSQVPCGDCSIFPKEYDYDRTVRPVKIRKVMDENDNSSGRILESYQETDKNQKIKDIHRTGAKCLKNEKKQDRHLPGTEYHVIGPLRTKPGRGNPTFSLSCSDKMAKWNLLGIQGSLLSLLIPQIKITSIVIGNGCPFSKEAMERGLYKRFGRNIRGPEILQSKVVFVHLKNPERSCPCPTSIIWCSVREREIEIAVEGRKHGTTKRKKGEYLLVTQRAFLESFFRLCDKHKLLNREIRHPKKLTYYDCKQLSVKYNRSWNYLKSNVFTTWPKKLISLQQFVL